MATEETQGSVGWLMAQQLQAMSDLMTRQLEVLGGHPTGASSIAGAAVNGQQTGTRTPKDWAPINFRRIKLSSEEGLTTQQQQFVDELIVRFSQRTAKSKAYAQQHREGLADWLSTLAYRQSLKEVTYPIVSTRSEGARFWDIDGNEYLDVSMGYGASYFGHNPSFVKEAIAEQLAEGMELAPQLDIAGEVADLIRELTGVERVAFTNTDTEALMAAVRIARAVTGRKKVVMFAGSTHGTFDSILAVDKGGHTFPLVPSAPQGMVDDVVIVNYGTDEALDQIRALSEDVAAVLVEPVQNRRLDFQPGEFLRELRTLTAELGMALIFDEMITGFRCHFGGAQAHFGVMADLVTYGKAVAGGMPIGIVAGKSRFMDVIDGGTWQYGDDSEPEKAMAFFGGTFYKHPLAMAATRACLLHMKAEGSNLQDAVNRRTEQLAQELNEFFEVADLPIRLEHFGSQFRLEGQGRYNSLLDPLEMALLFLMLMEKGIYACARQICYLVTAHTDADVAHIAQTLKTCVHELACAGFFPEASVECLSHNGEIRYAMTPDQQRMFLLSQFDGGEMTCHLSGAWLIDGPLEVDRLEVGFQHLVDRHEALRTGFEVGDNELVQVVRPQVDFELVRLLGEDSDAVIADFIRPFDHTQPPLFRAGICALDTDSHLLIMDVHHMALDGIALNILMRELMQFYAGEQLPPVPVKYRTFAKRLEAFGNSPTYREQESFWHGVFDGDVQEVILPADFDRPALSMHKGGQVIEAFATEQLQAVARNTGVSPNMVLLAAYYVWLYKVTGQDDLIVGTATSARRSGEEDLVGMATNTLALRTRIESGVSFRSMLNAVKKNCLEAYAHADFPIEEVIRSLGLSRGAGRHPLIDVMYTYERADERMLAFEGIEIRPYPYEKKAFLFDLELDVINQGGVVYLNFEYDASLFKRETIERFAGYYKHILNTVAKDPDCLVADLSLLNAEETEALLALAHGPVVDVGDAQCIADCFEAQVAKTPNAVAVTFRDVSLTYKQLNQCANRVAHHLRSVIDLNTDDRVGLLLERSEWLPIGIWGIIKSGASYVSLDMTYPKARLDYILQDSECRTVLSEASFADLLSELNVPHWVDVHRAVGSEENLKRTTRPNNLVYMAYTSGSTGKPKGVMVTHRNVIDFTANLTAVYKLSEGETFYALTTPTFDISVLELVSSLCVGLHIFIASKEQVEAPNLIAGEVLRLGVLAVQMTPTRLQLIIQTQGIAWLDSVRTLIVGGEALTETLASVLVELPNTRTFNSYGPTETTIWSSAGLLQRGQITVGTPLVNESVYIVSEDLCLMPPGINGEICIGGIGVGKGYANHPELTSERFVPNPFADGQLYRTGDRGYWLSDGRIVCMGRQDSQVKVRGFRVELGEVEHCLESQPDVDRAVVVVRHDELVAYLVGAGLKVGQLRDALAELLPNYMIPSRFMQLAELPLLPSGKVNRQALPEPTEEWFSFGTGYKAPGDELEQMLVDVWQQVWGDGHIGVRDNFFDLGGHSLKAAQIVARLQRQLATAVSIADLFANPVIADLAKVIRQRGHTQKSVGAIEKIALQETYELSHAQKRLWVLDQMLDTLPAYLMLDSFMLEGDLNIDTFDLAWQTLFARHEILRTTFVMIDGEPRQKVHDHPNIQLELIDLACEADPERAAREKVNAELQGSFNLETGPLLRLKLMALPAGDHGARYVFVFCAHHIVCDGWSVDVLLRELKTLYNAYCDGEENPLPPLKIQFRDYVAWQHTCLASGELELHRTFWFKNLGDYPPRLDLPSDFPRVEQQGFFGETQIFTLDKNLTSDVKALGIDHDATLFMALLSALEVLVYYYTSEEDVVLGTAAAGRDQADLEGQIGFYQNLIPLRTQLSANDRLIDVLKKVKDTVTTSLVHQAYPFDVLVENLGGHQDLSNHPLFDIMMTVKNRTEDRFELKGVVVSDFYTPMGGSKLDVNIWFEESEELTAFIEYNSALFKAERIETLWHGFYEVIKLFLNEPDIVLKDVQERLMKEAERTEHEAFLASLSNVDDDF